MTNFKNQMFTRYFQGNLWFEETRLNDVCSGINSTLFGGQGGDDDDDDAHNNDDAHNYDDDDDAHNYDDDDKQLTKLDYLGTLLWISLPPHGQKLGQFE